MSQLEDIGPLPDDFLSTPKPDISVYQVDFAKTDLPQYASKYAVILDDVLSKKECEQLIKAAESTTNEGWERAMINIGGGRQMLATEARNCGRIIWDSREVVGRVWKRIEDIAAVQQITSLYKAPGIMGNGPSKRGETWKFTRPNERMRFLKYVGGEYFRPHCDGCYETPDGTERSWFTLHLYLNDADRPTGKELAKVMQGDEGTCAKYGLVGGATTFHSFNMEKQLDVWPKAGRILIFQHRDLLHSGDDVLHGVKYTMRTDLMYSLDSVEGEKEEAVPANGGLRGTYKRLGSRLKKQG